MSRKWNKVGFGLSIVGLIFSMFCFLGETKTSLNDLKAKKEAGISETNYISDPDLFLEGEEADIAYYIPTVAKTENSTALKIFVKQNDSSNNNYMLGYYGSGDRYFPCSIQCTLKNKENGTTRISTTEVNFDYSLVKYVGLGVNLGPKEKELTCDIEHGVDEVVDLDKPIYIINVFKYVPSSNLEDEKMPNNFNEKFKMKGVFGSNAENTSYRVYDMADYCEFNYAGVSNFNGFSSFKVNVNSEKSVESYINDKTYGKSYKKYEEDIEAGTMYVRTRFSFGGDTRYVVEYKDGRKELVPDLANNIEIKNNETSLYFLLKNVNYKEVKNLSVKGGIIYVGIYNTNTYKEVSKTGFSIRFGYINFKIDDMLKANGAVGVEKDNKFYKFNCDLFIIISICVFALCYIATSLTIYFVLKNKYKDDEFRKMNTKLYFKNNILGLLCIGSLILFVEFCITRFGFLSNSLPVYNPSDVWVIIFGVGSLLLIGYFVRYFYLLIKARRERIRNEKLKLRLDKQDDGTISVK